MTDTETESAPVYAPLAFPFVWDSDQITWAQDNIYGKGATKFMRTLASGHYGVAKVSYKGRRNPPKRKRYISLVALQVWKDPVLRDQWYTYHKAVSRLVPDL
jgi:hypothetical protein